MKKNIILLGSLILSSVAYSQVGIDTQEPKATLDVVVKSDKLNKPFGIIAPRVTGVELRNAGGQFNADQDGAIVYATSSAETTTGRAKNVTQRGYYYFDATLDNGSTLGLWVALKNAPADYVEPWNIQGGTTASTSNNDAIYQTGNVAIGRPNGYTSDAKTVRLDVQGEIRTGAGQKGAIGINSVAMGLFNEASGDTSFAAGNSNKSIGDASFTVGSSNTANMNSDFAAGIGSTTGTISGNASQIAIGEYAFASGYSAVGIGDRSSATGKYSVAVGSMLKTLNDQESAYGHANLPFSANTNNPYLAYLGDGYDMNARSNMIVVQAGAGWTTGNFSNNWMAVGSGSATSISRSYGEKMKVYGGVSSTQSYVTDINSVIGATTDKLVVADPNTGQLKTITSSSLPNATYQEPWVVQGSTTPATTNSQAIYQNGAVSIWRDKVFESSDNSSAKVNLHVNGATRIGATDPALTKKVGVSSFAGGNAAVASGDNAMAYGTSVEASGVNSAALGNSNVSSGSSSFTAGTLNKVEGSSSVALGSSNEIDSNASSSIVGGLSNSIKNNSYSAVALGSGNKISQSPNTMAVGTSNIIGSKAKADASIALGSLNSIDSNYGAAIGLENEIGQYSNSSFALGQNARIAGTNDVNNAYNSYALGYKATVGYDSVDGTTVTGANSAYAIGSEALANGKYSYAIGYRANANAYGAIAIGTQNNINGSTVAPTVASGINSIAIGSGINVSKENNTAIGSYNIANLDASFAVGIGNDISSRKNGLMVFNDGTAAIGNYSSAPSFANGVTLQVNGGALANKAYVTDINSVTGTATDKIVVADGTGQLKTISATGASVSYKEPWNIQDSTMPSASNNDAIYQTGNVAIGRKKGYASGANTVRLDVQGEIRTGAGQKGVIGINSVAMGLFNEASGDNSVAMGNSNTASGANSAAFGNTAEASGIESFAAGSTTKASGVRSFATGWKTEVTGDNSAGFGYNNTISGVNSVAMGSGSKVKTNQSFAGGSGSTVTYSNSNTGDNSIAFGDVAQAVAASSAAFGKDTFATGEQSLVFGNGASTSGNYSLAGGYKTIADGIGSVAFGNESMALGNYSFAFGNANVIKTSAVGDHSFAFGLGAYSKFRHSVGIGAGASVPVRSGVVLGRYNAYTIGVYVDGSNDNNKPGDPIFQVGQGVSSSNRSNIITGFYGNGEDGSYRPGWVVIGSRTDLAAGSNYFDSPRLGTATLSVLGSFAAQGSITASGAVNANTPTFPDYVFEKYYTGTSNLNKDYQFNTLYETEKFIKEHKHLPGINSVSELEKTETGYSIDLGKTTTQTLEKVEELYLHTIEQQKQIDELKDIVKQQQKQIDQLLKK